MDKKKKNYIIIAVVLLLAIIGFSLNYFKDNKIIIDSENKDPKPITYQIIVDIKGAVNRPGLYYLDSNSRVKDAIDAAGGLTPLADISNINLATKLEDGMIVNIYSKSSSEEEKKISINKATLEELMKLPGVGEAKAKSIINYRQKNGYFMSLEDIKKVEGISETIYKQIKELICL